MATIMLRSSLLLHLALIGGGCGFPVPELPRLDGDEEATETAGTSTGGSASATSTTGSRPTTSSDSVDSSTTVLDPPSTEVDDDGGSTFIVDPTCGGPQDDGFGVRCSIIECSVAEQDCPEGEKCTPWANDGGPVWTAARCGPIVDDPAGLGEPCTVEGSPVSGFDDCQLGAMCFAVDPRTLQGTCVALCDEDDPSSCPDGEVCVAHDDYQPYVCLPRCDPTEPSACAADESCRPIGEELLCVPTVTLPEGLPCGTAEQHCAVEQACVSADALADCAEPACCTAWCDLSAPAPDLPCAATPGEVCRPYFDMPPTGYEHVGACGLPA